MYKSLLIETMDILPSMLDQFPYLSKKAKKECVVWSENDDAIEITFITSR